MAKKPTTNAVAALTLAALVAFGETGTFATAAAAKPLVDAGHAETNESVKNPANAEEIAIRATPAGIAAAGTSTDTATAATAATKPAKVDYEIEEGIAPSGKRGGGVPGATKYPFDKLEVGQSFFVAGDDAVKSMASTVSSATKRYATEKKDDAGNVVMRTNRKNRSVPELVTVRKFTLEAGEKAGVKGARIFRTA